MSASNQHPARLSDDEIIEEIRSLRQDLDRTARRVLELSNVLGSRASSARREGDLVGSATLAYANAWTRVGAMVGQATQRASSTERLVDQTRKRVQQDRERKAVDDQRKQRREAARATIRHPGAPESPADDLMELYGKEVMNGIGR